MFFAEYKSSALDRGWTRALRYLVVGGLAIASILLTACSENLPALPAWRVPPDRSIQEDRIREAIFRYLIKQKGLKGQVFLSVEREDPSDEFMARFAGMEPRPKKASGAYFKRAPFPGWLRDRATGEKGVMLNVGTIGWNSSTVVEVRGGSYCGGLCADAGVFRVAKKNHQWVVEEYEVRIVS